MRRRVGVMLLGLVAALFVATESASACKFLDGFFSRMRARRCCVSHCWARCCPADMTCCMPAVCAPAEEDAPVDPAVEEPSEEPAKEPAEEPSETPSEEPSETPSEEPKEPAEPPVEEPTPPPVEEPTPPVEEPTPPPVEEPAEPPVEEPTPPPVEEPTPPPVEEPTPPPVEEPTPPPVEEPTPPPTEKPKPSEEDDPFAGRETKGRRLWTDISGKYQVEAEFVSFVDETVRLKKANGRYCRVALQKLSLADQAFVRGIGSVAMAP